MANYPNVRSSQNHVRVNSKTPIIPGFIVGSIVRPNLTFAQAARQARVTTQAPVPQQMAPRAGPVPATSQTQTARRQISPTPADQYNQ
ncbi:hypothetical protein TNCV_2855061 [Trichonephila clavipes]|nr:hypothetical protein TNCV_2855061 [Trichonephila clavipes]